MKIELNGKALLGMALLSSSIVFAKYVVVLDSHSEYSAVEEQGLSDSEIEDLVEEKLNEVNPVGTIVMRIDSVNPSTIYGGSWELLSANASLRMGDGSPQTGSVVGSDIQAVPVPAHTHTATQSAHSHNKGSMNITGEFGNGFYGEFGHTSATGAFTRGASAGSTKYTGEGWTSNGPKVSFNAANSWSGETNSVAPSITVAQAGVANASIDVSGAHIKVNVWKRKG